MIQRAAVVQRASLALATRWTGAGRASRKREVSGDYPSLEYIYIYNYTIYGSFQNTLNVLERLQYWTALSGTCC